MRPESARSLARMLDREWVSITNPDDDHDRYLFDVTVMLSALTCIYGRGCPGTGTAADPALGCCAHGAHYVDAEDRARVEAVAAELAPEHWQRRAEGQRHGVSAAVPGDGEVGRTRVRDGACIFLNRADFPGGAGCALHVHARARGEHHMTHKPEVCWIVPLRREVARDVADDGEDRWTTTITTYDRGAWGPGGADFGWWCTDSPEAFVGAEPVYRSMAAELQALSTPAVHAELAAYLDDRRGGRRPLPLLVRLR